MLVPKQNPVEQSCLHCVCEMLVCESSAMQWQPTFDAMPKSNMLHLH